MIITPIMEKIFRESINTRHLVVVAGRRFGKSTLSLAWLLGGKISPGDRRWIVYPTYRMGKSVGLPILKKMLAPSSKVRWNESELSCTVNGAEIAIKGAEDPSKLRGVSLNKVVLDEYSYMKPGVWEEVIYPTLTTDPSSRAMFIGTPNGFQNGFYDLFLKGQPGGEPDWKSWQFTTEEGGFVPKEELERAKRNMDERTYRQEFLSSFESASNRVAYNFNRSDHIKEAPEALDVYEAGMDFNVGKMVVCLFYRYSDGQTVHYFDEVVLRDSNTEEMAITLKERFPKLKNIYCDSSGKNRSTTSNKSDFTLLREYGFNPIAKRANPPVKERIMCLNRKLKDAEGRITMTVSAKCQELIKDLEQCQRDNKTGGIDKRDDARSHAIDACSYPLAFLFPYSVNKVYSVKW